MNTFDIKYTESNPKIETIGDMKELSPEFLTALGIIFDIIPLEDCKSLGSFALYILSKLYKGDDDLPDHIPIDTPGDMDFTTNMDSEKYDSVKNELRALNGKNVEIIIEDKEFEKLDQETRIDTSRIVLITIIINGIKIVFDIHISDNKHGIFTLTNTRQVTIKINEKNYTLNIANEESIIASYLTILINIIQEAIESPDENHRVAFEKAFEKRLKSLKKMLNLMELKNEQPIIEIIESVQFKIFLILECIYTLDGIKHINIAQRLSRNEWEKAKSSFELLAIIIDKTLDLLARKKKDQNQINNIGSLKEILQKLKKESHHLQPGNHENPKIIMQ